jgi:antitoxin component of MazEF toxin-antitoxin module
MAEIFEAKVRKVGNSLGIIIPGELAEAFGFGAGDMISVSLPVAGARARGRKLRALAGTEPRLPMFEREKEDRF